MPQTFQVLRCYKCLVFQVHQTKKSIKWECKLCGEKQSIKRHYGVGTGKDCRVHVQKLNSLRGEIDEFKCSQMRRNVESDCESDLEGEIQNLGSQQAEPQNVLHKESKWSNYIDEPEVIEESKEPMCLGDAEVVLEIPKKRRKEFQKYSNARYKDNENKSQSYTATSKIITQNNHCSFKAPELKVNNSQTTQEVIVPQVKTETSATVSRNISNSLIKEKENFKPKVPVKKFIPPVINKNSKWAQYAEDDEEEVSLSPSLSASQSDLKFSLCDDNDLDSVLDL